MDFPGREENMRIEQELHQVETFLREDSISFICSSPFLQLAQSFTYRSVIVCTLLLLPFVTCSLFVHSLP